MAMMRRGPLAQYSAEWVLRQASATGATGSVEFHTNAPMTLYLRGGEVCHGVDGVPASGFVTGTEDGEHADEAAARAQSAALVARALRATEGWYYFDPLGHHDDAGPWQWETAALIRDARVQLQPPNPPGPPPLAAPTPVAAAPARAAAVPATPAPAAPRPAPIPVDRRVRLIVPEDTGPVALSAESWRIVCALVAPRAATELREVLGWSPARLDAALTELASAGVMDAPPERAPVATAAAVAVPAPAPAPERRSRTVAAPPAPAPAPAVPPTVPPVPGSRPVVSVDRRSALRRLISNLKPA